MEHEVALDGRDPFKLRRKSVEGSCAIGRALRDIFHNLRQQSESHRDKLVKPTRRILIYDLLKLVATQRWEVVVVDVLLELCIGPGRGNQDELSCGRRSTHVTLRLAKLNKVPSSSQLP